MIFKTMTRKDYMKEYYLMHKEGNRLKSIWCQMIRRCYDPKSISFKYYGQKGIAVCPEWRRDFTEFKKWSIDHGYANELTIDRIDSNKDYFPDNCRWVTRKIQQNNTSYNHRITYNGVTRTMKEWTEITGISYYALNNRIRRGWSIERMLTEPTHNYRKEG